MLLRGVMTAMVTPFSSDGREVDEGALDAFVAWQLEAGVHGLVPCGTTGESATLTPEEHDRVIERVVKAAAGKAPVVAGTGSNATAEAIERTRRAEAAGADAAMVVVPYYNKPSQEGLLRHYEAVLEATDSIPILAYNVPHRTAADLANETIERLLGHERFIGVKDASADLTRPADLALRVKRAGRAGDFRLLTGEDPSALAHLAEGGHGCISVTANFAPHLAARLQDAWAEGDLKGAQAAQLALSPLSKAAFSAPSPGPVKAGLAMMGRMTQAVRLPMLPPPDEAKALIRRTLEEAKLL